MIGQNSGRDDGHDDFTQLDALLEETMGGVLTHLEAAFAPRERLAQLRTRDTTSPAPPKPRNGLRADSAALTAVCDQVDTLDHCLAQAISSTAADPFPGAAFLEAARPPLRQLRSELAGRSATRDQAEQTLSRVQQNITHADTILDGTLDDLLDKRIPGPIRSAGALSRQLRELTAAIARLYDDATDSSVLTPAS